MILFSFLGVVKIVARLIKVSVVDNASLVYEGFDGAEKALQCY